MWKNSNFARKFPQNFHVVVAWNHYSPTLMTINYKGFYIFGNVLTWGSSEWLWFFHSGFALKKKGWWMLNVTVKLNVRKVSFVHQILSKWSAPKVKIIQWFELILIRYIKIWSIMTIVFFYLAICSGCRQWRQKYHLMSFQILSIGSFLRPEINSVHRYDGDNLFISEHNSQYWVSIWEIKKKSKCSIDWFLYIAISLCQKPQLSQKWLWTISKLDTQNQSAKDGNHKALFQISHYIVAPWGFEHNVESLVLKCTFITYY